MSAAMSVTWEGLSAAELAARCGVSRLELYAVSPSTQDVAHALAEGGAPAGTVVLADAQQSGRGRLGRSWHSAPGSGVWCTLIERPSRNALDVLSLRVGLYCAEALDVFAGERVGVKWPNDMVLQIPRRFAPRDDTRNVIPSAARDLQLKKLGGVLVEARWTGKELAWVAIGVGVNVRAPDIKGAAGLREGTSRVPLLVAIVSAVRAASSGAELLTSDEMKRFRVRDALAGRRIVFPAHGTVEGITAAGALVVATARGVEEVRSGTVHLADEWDSNGEDRA